MKEIGKVTHYYGKINVAIIKLSGSIKVGDKIKIQGGTHDFEQEVKSMQIEHDKVEEAKKGDVIGLEVTEKAPDSSVVYKMEE